MLSINVYLLYKKLYKYLKKEGVPKKVINFFNFPIKHLENLPINIATEHNFSNLFSE